MGLLSFSSFLFLITLALIQGNHRGWQSTEVLSEFAGAGVLFILFIFIELRQERPMLDLSFFRNPTYVGANIAGLSFAACLLTMLTFLPIYFQGGLGVGAQTAGLLMLPMAVPLFIVPRVVVAQLSHRYTGRALLTAGLVILSAGLVAMALAAPYFRYAAMLAGMMLAGVGAGILNGEVAKVGMTAIPPARAGMASGMSGTIRFSGIVVGFAALGAVLVARISALVGSDTLATGISSAPEFVRNIAAGNITAAAAMGEGSVLRELSLRSFGGGYQTILFTAGLFALVASILCWNLIRAEDTAVAVRVVEAPPIE